MPSRVVRGDINASDSLSRVSLEADLTFRALLVGVDDYGRLDARPAFLKSVLFPCRDTVTAADVAAWVRELDQEGCLRIYEVQGRRYLELTGWERHRARTKRAERSRYPAPPPPGASPDLHGSPRGSMDSQKTLGIHPSGMESSIECRGEGESEGERREAPGTLASEPKLAPAVADSSPRPRRKGPKSRTGPPEDLTKAEKRELFLWCQRHHPEYAEPRQLRKLVDACLDHHRAKGHRHADWLATCRSWIRQQPRYGAIERRA